MILATRSQFFQRNITTTSCVPHSGVMYNIYVRLRQTSSIPMCYHDRTWTYDDCQDVGPLLEIPSHQSNGLHIRGIPDEDCERASVQLCRS